MILGGGEFVGGRVSPIGAVIGAMTLTLAGSFLSFLRLNPDWQIGAQGAILIIVLALRVAHLARGGAGVTALRAPRRQPWLWSWLGALAVWLAIVAFTGGQGGAGVLTAALTFATFYVLVALGQMFVITLGPGNVDLSIPACMTLAGTVAMKVMHEANRTDPARPRARGADRRRRRRVNYALIRFLRIPPIIATLCSSFVFQSAAIWYNRGLRIKPPPALADFTTMHGRWRSASSPSWSLVASALLHVRPDPHDLRPQRHRHRPEHPRRPAGRRPRSSAPAS